MISLYARLAAAAAVLVALAGLWWHGYSRGAGAVKLEWQAERAAQVQATLEAERQAREIERQRVAAAQEVVNRAKQETAAARAAAAAAERTARGLRDAAFAVADSCAAGSATAASGGQAGARVLAELLGDVEAAGRRMAAEADRAITAGRACERFVDAVTARQ